METKDKNCYRCQPNKYEIKPGCALPVCKKHLFPPKENKEEWRCHAEENGVKCRPPCQTCYGGATVTPSVPQTPDREILAATLDKVLETCNEKTRLELFGVFMRHIAMNPKDLTPDSMDWEKEYDALVNDYKEPKWSWETSEALKNHLVKICKELKPLIRKHLALAHSSGRREGIELGKRVFMQEVDWAEWGLSEEEAGKDYDEHVKSLLDKDLEQ